MINSLYTYDTVLDQIKQSFKTSKPQMILLPDFLGKDTYDSLLRSMNVKGERRTVPDMYSFTSLESSECKKIFGGDFFVNYIKEITGVKGKLDLEVRKFCHRDYSLIHDEQNGGKLEFVFFLGKWDKSYGGYSAYSSGDGKPLIIDPKPNSLFIIKTNGMHSFTKYINHLAGKNALIKIEGKIT